MNELPQINWHPYQSTQVDLSTQKLEQKWDRLHIGNSEIFPSTDNLRDFLGQYPLVAASLDDYSLTEISATLIQGWLNFHQGNYQDATQLGLASGNLGLNLASKSIAIYATHLETDDATKLVLFQTAISLAEQAIKVMPENPDSYYNLAYALGRYGQGISITKALAEGHAKTVYKHLEKTLELDPDHAEAHIAFGTYHAEIINQVGKLVASISYGANKDAGLKHFRTAIRMAPDFPIAYTQYADGLVMMFGKPKLKEARQLYQKAVASEVVDAMEQLDQDNAAQELDSIK